MEQNIIYECASESDLEDADKLPTIGINVIRPGGKVRSLAIKTIDYFCVTCLKEMHLYLHPDHSTDPETEEQVQQFTLAVRCTECGAKHAIDYCVQVE